MILSLPSDILELIQKFTDPESGRIIFWALGPPFVHDKLNSTQFIKGQARLGHLNILKSMPLTYPEVRTVAEAAALENQTEVVLWAKDVWDCGIAAAAASRGHLNLLKLLRIHGCPWDKRTCFNAAMGGHSETFEYAISRNCPSDEALCRWALFTTRFMFA